jgi:hypothetical protein
MTTVATSYHLVLMAVAVERYKVIITLGWFVPIRDRVVVTLIIQLQLSLVSSDDYSGH